MLPTGSFFSPNLPITPKSKKRDKHTERLSGSKPSFHSPSKAETVSPFCEMCEDFTRTENRPSPLSGENCTGPPSVDPIVHLTSFRDHLPEVDGFDSNSDSDDYMEDIEYSRLTLEAQNGYPSRRNWESFLKTYFGSEKKMTLTQAYAAYKRKERALASVPEGELEVKQKLSRSLKALGTCIKVELDQRKVSDFWGNEGDAHSPTPLITHFNTLPREEAFSEAVEDAKVQERIETTVPELLSNEGVKTPPKNAGRKVSLFKRLMNAPFKKSIVDIPEYAYNSDDDF